MNQNQQSQLKQLITKGKEQGFLTYAQVNDHLPDDIVDPEQIEDIINMINDMGISVHEKAPDADTLILNDAASSDADDDTAAEEAAAALAAALSHGREGEVRPPPNGGTYLLFFFDTVHPRVKFTGSSRALHFSRRKLKVGNPR